MADANDIEALQRQIAELPADLRAALLAQLAGNSGPATVAGDNSGPINTGKQTDTGGGAMVEGAVNAGGHFIGRDFVQYVVNVVQAGEDAEEAKSVIALYLHALTADLAGLKLGEIDASADQTKQTPLQLADVYVPLDTTLRVPEEMSLNIWLENGRSERDAGHGAERKTRPASALEAAASHRELTLLGQPGGGKSTFGASLLLALAQTWQGHGDELAKLGETWTHGALLPIRVVLRRFAERLPPGAQPARAGDLWAFIGDDLDAAGYGLSSDAMKYVQRIARNQGALILLDGLDECGDAAKRRRVMAAVEELMRNAGPQCRFVLTARPYAWPDGPNPQQGVYLLADFDDGQIERFIHGWYAALEKRGWSNPGEAQRKRDDLLAARQRADLLPLARNPLLLTLMATLHSNKGRLPDDRADLYNESVDLLLMRWNRQIGADKALLDELAVPGLKLSDLRETLEKLAFQVHEQNSGRDGAADIGEDKLVRAFRPLLHDSRDKAAIVVDYIEKRAGLLIGQGEKYGERQFSFPHRTFQEFLAACHLAAKGDFAAECVRLARAAPAHWQVVLPLAARLAKAERGAGAADALVGRVSIADFSRTRQPAIADWTAAILAGNQLLEIGISSIRQDEGLAAIAYRVAGWLAAALPVHPDDGGLEAIQRAEAGEALSRLGDPRFDAQRFHLPTDDMLGFVRIAPDPAFRIGARKADRERINKIVGVEVDDDEINDAPTPTPELYIARYPVTVAQFRAYLEAAGREPGDADALSDLDNLPVRWVDWRKALAYCRWLNEALKTAPALASSEVARLVRGGGWEVCLPSELEWEKAARGGLEAAIYPWGDPPDPNRANYDDTQINGASAVGCFPPNGYGLYDMAGNVWEWTRSLWGFDYPYVANDPPREDLQADGSRVVRGGSWNDYRDVARCAFRYGLLPDVRYSYLGFRVVLRSSPVT